MQASLAVYEFMKGIRMRQRTWTMGMYSGYSIEELDNGTYASPDAPLWSERARRMQWNGIKRLLAFAILGRYDRARLVQPLDTRPELRMCSSSNQRLVLFSRRYSYDDFQPLSVEFSISDSGLTTVTGFPL